MLDTLSGTKAGLRCDLFVLDLQRVRNDGVGMSDARLAFGLAAIVAVAAASLFSVFGGDGVEVSERVGDAESRVGWQTIKYEDVRVDIPGEWRRMDTSDCPFQVERWGEPGSDSCGRQGAGVSFLADMGITRYGPGEVRTFQGGSIWSGYVEVAQMAVSADGSKQVVEGVLASAQVASAR